MPRTKKPVVEELEIETPTQVLEQEKPINQVIKAPMIDATIAELTVAGYTIIPPDSKMKISSEEIVEENIVPKLVYDIYCKGELVDSCPDGSDSLNDYLTKNEDQLYSWIEKLSTPTDNEEDLALFNVPPNGLVYKSLRQYYLQNGLAPRPPKVTDWMTYYMRKHYPITPEEIAVLVKGDLDYSFIPRYN